MNHKEISPLNGRYAKYLTDVAGPKERLEAQLRLEYEWAKRMLKLLLPSETIEVPEFEITPELLARVAEIEAEVKHDVKAIERAIAEFFFPDHREVVHLFMTSEDTNASGNGEVMVKNTDIIKDALSELSSVLEELLVDMDYEVVARTHGQPACVTTYTRRLWKYWNEINLNREKIVDPTYVKFGGGIGDLDAMHHAVLFGDHDSLVQDFIEGRGYKRDEFTMQTSFYNHYAEHFDSLRRVCLFVTKILYDLWDGFSRGHFVIVTDGKQVGSSIFANKTNPANIEGGIGNLKIAIAGLNHLSNTLPTFRLERDLTDSTQLRNLPVVYAHMLLGLRIAMRDLRNIRPSEELISGEEVNQNAQTYSASIQTALRVLKLTKTVEEELAENNNVPIDFDPYEVLRKGTQGRARMTKLEMWDLCLPYFRLFNEVNMLSRIMNYSPPVVNINTSNVGKMYEYGRVFWEHGRGTNFTNIDVREPDADQTTVLSYKAHAVYCQLGKSTWVEDTALFIDGADVGVNVRWLLNTIDKHNGKNASFDVMMGRYVPDKNIVEIYTGRVAGTIGKFAGKGGFGFDAYFYPTDNPTKSLAESKPDRVNARWHVVQEIVTHGSYTTVDAVKSWDGEWQNE